MNRSGSYKPIQKPSPTISAEGETLGMYVCICSRLVDVSAIAGTGFRYSRGFQGPFDAFGMNPHYEPFVVNFMTRKQKSGEHAAAIRMGVIGDAILDHDVACAIHDEASVSLLLVNLLKTSTSLLGSPRTTAEFRSYSELLSHHDEGIFGRVGTCGHGRADCK